MQPTHRFWETLAVAGILAVAAMAFAQPLLLLAPAGIAAWLFASQLGFVYAVGRLDDSLTISQTLDRAKTVTDEPVTATLAVEGDDAGLRTVVTARTSAGLDAAGELQTTPGDTTSFTVESDVAGTHHLEALEVEVRDPSGLFTEQFTRGEAVELIVDARRPKNIHVGEGGRSLPTAFGDHTLQSTGQGLMPAELRTYMWGEPASRIDWKATARLSSPYVREYEAESDQTTLLVFDARSSLGTGLSGETALDYLRTIALSHVAVAQRLGDPLGCYGIDDQGIRRFTTPTNSVRGYELARRRLHGLTASTGPQHARRSLPIHRRSGQFDSATRFGQVLQSYLTARPAADPESNPLQTAVRSTLANVSGPVRLVIYTDDTDRAGIREVVREARRGDYTVDFFLAPTVLFEPDTLADLSGATERYRDFEAFRRELVHVDGISAYEVAPQSRIETVLERERAVVRE